MMSKQLGHRGRVCVTFTMPVGIWADSIHLVGDFNDWDTAATPLHQDDQCWSVTLELDAGRAYEYRYLINGADWCNDWRADYYAPNDLGGDNSVVIATLERERQHTTRPRQHAFERHTDTALAANLW